MLESSRRVDTVVLDKTGTVTTGRMSLVDMATDDGVSQIEALRLAGAVERASEHPIARAIAAGAADRVDALPAVADFASIEGLGVSGTVDGRAVLVGRPRLLAERGYEMPGGLAEAVTGAQLGGRTVVAAGWDGAVRAVLVIADTVKTSSAEAVRQLRELGLRPVLLTGDNAAAARSVAAQVGIDEVYAEVLPADKVNLVRRLQAEDRVVAMVGDGVNDAAALAQADLGLAMGTGTDVAIEASDLTLVRGDLRVAADAIRLSRRTLRTIKGNLFWAFAYNAAALPLAAAGLLNPMIAGTAMALSSVFVVSNSLRLRAFRPLVAPPELGRVAPLPDRDASARRGSTVAVTLTIASSGAQSRPVSRSMPQNEQVLPGRGFHATGRAAADRAHSRPLRSTPAMSRTGGGKGGGSRPRFGVGVQGTQPTYSGLEHS